MPNIPTTIFTGFLGSGKTTIISHLIDQLQAKGEQVVFIKNEIGETDIDSLMMQQKGIETEELLNGCICCTLVGPFLHSIDELIERFSPDRIIIEASGAADPAALALMVSSHPKLERDGVISIIDVLNFEGYQDLTITAKEQTKFTDLLVFNKVELVDLDHKKRIVGYVRELNTQSPIIEAPEGKIDISVVFGITSKELDQLLTEHGQSQSHEHIKTDSFESTTLTSTNTFSQEKLTQKLSDIPKNIFRAKGIVHTQQGWQILNMVAGRTTFTSLNNEKPYGTGNHSTNGISNNVRQRPSLFVFIGVHINNKHKQLEDILESSSL